MSASRFPRFITGRGWLAILYSLGVFLSIFALFSRWAYDDPFITYRYAENLAQGLGFVYNPGERVLSTTTPLFTLLLAALHGLWPDLHPVANLIGAFGLALGALCLWDLARIWQAPWVGYTFLLLYPTFGLLLATLGSETSLYLAFCLGAFTFYARQRYHLTALCAALALLTRGDGLLVAALLTAHNLLWAWRERRPFPWSAVLLYLSLTVPWFLFATWYFGNPLPATLAAKQQQGSMAISQRFAAGLLTIARGYTAYGHYWAAAGLAAAGGVFVVARARRWILFGLWPVVYFASYTLLGVSRYFWYYAPLVPGFLVAVGLGFELLWMGGQRWRPGWRGWRWLIGVCLLALALLQANDAVRLSGLVDQRYRIYRAAGEWLRANTPPEAKVGTLEVGIIGYYARRPIIDFAGLIQPEVAKQLRLTSTYEDSARWAIRAYQPEYLVLGPTWFPNLMNDSLLLACSTQKTFPGGEYGYSGEIIVYQCAWPK